MTFREFLAKRKVTYDANGDFTNEALATVSFSGARSWEELRERVGKVHGFAGVEAARSIWRAYVDQARKAEKPPAKGHQGESRPAAMSGNEAEDLPTVRSA